MTWTIAPIVEGHGDVVALPKLLFRIRTDIRVTTPVRFPKSKLTDPSELRRAASIALANIPLKHDGLILLLLDADDNCPAELGPRLLSVLEPCCPHVRCFVSVARREFESWIVGGIAEFDEPEPERTGTPKARIATRNEGKYKEAVDQARFASRVDVKLLTEHSPSFRRLFDTINSLSS